MNVWINICDQYIRIFEYIRYTLIWCTENLKSIGHADTHGDLMQNVNQVKEFWSKDIFTKRGGCPVAGCSWWSCWPSWPWWQGLTFSLPPPPFYSYDSSFIMPRLPHGKANDGKPLFITWRCDLLLWYWMLLRLRMPSQVREGFFKVDSHTSYLTDARMAMQSIYWLKATTKAILILLREFLAPVDLKTLFSFPRYSHLKMPEGTNHISIAYFRGW